MLLCLFVSRLWKRNDFGVGQTLQETLTYLNRKSDVENRGETLVGWFFDQSRDLLSSRFSQVIFGTISLLISASILEYRYSFKLKHDAIKISIENRLRSSC